MNKMKTKTIKHLSRIAIGIAMLLISVQQLHANDFRSTESARRYQYDQLTSPVKNAGYDIRSVMSLDAALNSSDIAVQTGAAYLLGENGDGEAIPVLHRFLSTGKSIVPVQIIKLMVCEALYKLHDEPQNWVPACKQILEVRDTSDEIGAALLLAKVENTDGWKVVRDQLMNLNDAFGPRVQEAAKLFHGQTIKTLTGSSKIDVIEPIVAHFAAQPEGSQLYLIAILEEVAKPSDLPRIKSLEGSIKTQTTAYNRNQFTKLLQKLG